VTFLNNRKARDAEWHADGVRDIVITFTAQNGEPEWTAEFTLTVNQAPAFTSATVATFQVGAAGTFSVNTSGFPTPSITRADLAGWCDVP